MFHVHLKIMCVLMLWNASGMFCKCQLFELMDDIVQLFNNLTDLSINY